MNINKNHFEQNTYDAIVVGSGISGGWAAKELTQKGLKVLVLERGRNIEHVKDYKTALTDPWNFEHGGKAPLDIIAKHPIQNRTGFTITESTHEHFVNDLENPYLETKRFDWIRGYHVGGRSLMWGRVSLRWSDIDFEANLKEGIGIDWPIRYKDIAPWYSYAEKFAGICGTRDGLPHLPDGEFQPPIEFTCAEEHFSKTIRQKFPNRYLIHGRGAHITQPTAEQTALGRASCQSRDMCMRGCPFGAYFSSQAATLPAAQKTGNLTVRPHSIVNSIIYDEQKKKAKGVRVIDERTGEWHEFFAKIVFLNASALGSTFILLNSTSNRFPNGMDDSGQLGHNLMDHHFRIGAYGETELFKDKYYKGRNPVGGYVPRFRNIGTDKRDYLRGFGYEGGARRYRQWAEEEEFGASLKNKQTQIGNWSMDLGGFGECLPYYENKVELSKEITDKWGQPVLRMDAEFKENELKMRVDMKNDAAEMLEAAGFKNVNAYDEMSYPGLGIHEMGTARMGHDAKTSVLNKWNQVWACKNVFVTDGAFMTSASCVNPSLTYMAMTARAADYAVKELKKGNL
ncbi:GMC family oxidoreductase [Arcicella lustrica]|uniref:GMC family oxidoreductase n=1 Tax=Arcicella lustrica TaxID=2984196 RepID=A0ABU5SQC1_9BACT|nr:GMC family oxidoreductase [Arcicella sp. DC25W]MEA5429506.1 GMC family oxidoreductase [Arcicella sp. DC25W]